MLAEHIGKQALVAPHLSALEITDVMRRRVRRGALRREEAFDILEDFFALGMRILPEADGDRGALHYRALALANEYALPATYDAHYMALAEALRCEFWIADRRLLRALNGRAGYVRALDEFRAR